VDERMKASGAAIEKLRGDIASRLSEAGIPAEVTGRVKRLWSIRQKLIRQSIPLDQLYDVLAFRVLVDSVRDCYSALGIVHQAWRPVPGRIKDYIAMPKQNFYQSLHTTVIPEGEPPFEIQIRTREMDLVAEQGIAATGSTRRAREPAGGRGGDRGDPPDPRDDARHREPEGVPLLAEDGPLCGRGLHVHAEGGRLLLPAGRDAGRLRLPDPHRRRAPLRRRARERPARPAPDAARQRRHRRDPHGAVGLPVARLARVRRHVAGANKIRAFLQTKEKQKSIEIGRRTSRRS
jgi:Guanosine polyphosphate pyrophosphohydrolases/synthetases